MLGKICCLYKGHFSVCVPFQNTNWLNSCHTLPAQAMSLACILRSTAIWLSPTAPNNQTIQTQNQALESLEMVHTKDKIQPNRPRTFSHFILLPGSIVIHSGELNVGSIFQTSIKKNVLLISIAFSLNMNSFQEAWIHPRSSAQGYIVFLFPPVKRF